jgi:SAM-dependent methyltransferase
MRAAVVGEGFDLVYVVFNSLSNVTTQDGQVAVFENAAAQLRPGGAFVVEMFVPVLQRLAPGETVRTFHHEKGRRHSFDEYDVARQLLQSHHYSYGADGTYRLSSATYRYAWPAELDLMARIAGMRLRERWEWWDRTPFAAGSESHVSVWEKQ